MKLIKTIKEHSLEISLIFFIICLIGFIPIGYILFNEGLYNIFNIISDILHITIISLSIFIFVFFLLKIINIYLGNKKRNKEYPKTQEELIDYINKYRDYIFVWEKINGKQGRYSLSQLPKEIEARYIGRFIENGTVPVRLSEKAIKFMEKRR